MSDDELYHVPRRRREDQSAWALFNVWVTKFAGLIAAAGVVGTAIAAVSGIRVLTYADDLADLRSRYDTTAAAVLTMRADLAAMRVALDSVKRTAESLKLMRCMDNDVSPQQLGLVQIECPAWTVQGKIQGSLYRRGRNGLSTSYPRSSSWWLGSVPRGVVDATLWY